MASLAEERTKTHVVSREWDDALQVACGGSAMRRIARAAKWFTIGVVAGAVAATLAR